MSIDTAVLVSMSKAALLYADNATGNIERIATVTGLTESTIKTKEIGLAPDSWDFLTRNVNLTKKDVDNLETVGWIQRGKTGRRYDFFRNRIIYPIIVSKKTTEFVVGITGRDLSGAEDVPKYLHSPASPYFSRDSVLFNDTYKMLKKYVVLTEGPKDALKLGQLGIPNAMAVLGSSLSTSNAVDIVNMTKTVWLFMDGDQAGIDANYKAIKKIWTTSIDVTLSVITPKDKDADPSDVVDSSGSLNDLKNHVTKVSALNFMIQYITEQVKDVRGAIEKEAAYIQKVNDLASECSLPRSVTDKMKSSIVLSDVSETTGEFGL